MTAGAPAPVDHAALARTLVDALGLREPPIAVCLTDAVPAGLPGPRRAAPAGCAFWAEAAHGIVATSAGDHDLCAIGTFTHNLDGDAHHEAERGAALRVFANLGYVRPEDIPGIPVLARRPRHVIYAPLAQTPLPPDVVLLFARPAELLILAEAAQSVDGGLPPAMGRPACAVVPQAVNSGRAALSLGCCGARAYLAPLAPDIALFALPGPRLAEYAKRVAELAAANAVLARFHDQRRQDVEAGRRPTIQESLAAMEGGGRG